MPLSGWGGSWPADLETGERRGGRRSPCSNPGSQPPPDCPGHHLSRVSEPPDRGPSPAASAGLPASLTAGAGPYIVYMLQEIDILEDWTAIKKVGLVLPASSWVRLAVQAPPMPRYQLWSLDSSPHTVFLRTWGAPANLWQLCPQPRCPGITVSSQAAFGPRLCQPLVLGRFDGSGEREGG